MWWTRLKRCLVPYLLTAGILVFAWIEVGP